MSELQKKFTRWIKENVTLHHSDISDSDHGGDVLHPPKAGGVGRQTTSDVSGTIDMGSGRREVCSGL